MYFVFIKSADKTSVVLFSADWAEQCKQVQDVMEDLAKILADKLAFVKIIAEDFPEIAMKHQVSRTRRAIRTTCRSLFY